MVYRDLTYIHFGITFFAFIGQIQGEIFCIFLLKGERVLFTVGHRNDKSAAFGGVKDLAELRLRNLESVAPCIHEAE